MEQEFIIALTEHRVLGHIFTALMIEKGHQYYTITRTVKLRDYKNGQIELSEAELQLLKTIENFSDENITKKFTRGNDINNFLQNIDEQLFNNHIRPYIDKYVYRCALLLMKGSTRLFQKQFKYANLYDEDELLIGPSFSESLYSFERNENGTSYKLKLWHEGKPLDILNKNIRIACTLPCCFVLQNRLHIFKSLSGKKLAPFLVRNVVSIPRQAEDKYYQTFVLNSIKESKVEAVGFEITETNQAWETVLSLEPDLSTMPAITVKFKCGNQLCAIDSISDLFVEFKKKHDSYLFVKTVRNRKWEEGQLDILKKLGLKFKNGFWLPEANNSSDNNYGPITWLTEHNEILKQRGFIVKQKNLDKVFFIGEQTIDFEVRNCDDWFDIHATVQFGSFRFPFIKLRKHILKGIREFILPSGEVAILPSSWFASYSDIFLFAKSEGDTIKLRKHHFRFIQDKINGINPDFLQKLTKPATISSVEIPAELKATLRNYQKEGYAWMHHLHDNRLGGCLADDMGLGKTIQTLALLVKTKKQREQTLLPVAEKNQGMQLSLFDDLAPRTSTQPASLVVMPTSLIHNWENEIHKFAPSLKVYKHVGNLRKKSNEIKQAIDYYDLILTTYGTIRNDVAMFAPHNFWYLILDEGQNIKNASSKTYKSLLQINSEYKLVITGTPIENSLSDLWSQLNFLNRGLLGSLPYFKREFIVPIEKKNDEGQQIKLQNLIRPFVLRRKKEEVVNDLPELTEQINYCEMNDIQKEVYNSEKSAIRNALLENIETKGLQKSALIVLQGLTRLRQLSNHPLLVNSDSEIGSAKFDEIYRCLKNIVAEKHKVLIFSSFVKHLELVQAKIESKNWKYSKLTGKTENREKTIVQFQNDPDNHIFLISLKAGGVGLNLTSADYVFIIDPWWNPAAENQAISRAHRIGQSKKVFVYRFITKDSIEEKIQVLKEKKSALASMFIHTNNPMEAVNAQEIIGLFS